jgi:hypothetical protein
VFETGAQFRLVDAGIGGQYSLGSTMVKPFSSLRTDQSAISRSGKSVYDN